MTARFGERLTAGFHSAFEGRAVHSERSSFQKIDVYDHEYFGRVLTLDDLIQTTERDEFCYHEMLVHPTLCSRDRVERVLIIGGGDGGALRHVLRHGPAEVVMCEIDEAVVRVSKEYLPSLAGAAFDDPRAKLVIDDGAAFVGRCKDAFDAIIVDSTDPIGVATVLFSPEFYESCRKALRGEGVIVSQTGSPLYRLDEFRVAVASISSAFGVAESYVGVVPTYPGVMWSFTVGTNGMPLSATSPDEVRARLEARGIATRYYTPEIHAGAFALPAFVGELSSPARVSTVSRG